ncbi:Hyaluronan synthase [uncultured Clostridium sp.]|uniref:Glycosyltransferase family 2 protein n=1 Tax=Muricoprocola aceti TaxID=2981772 RepID=A0ABT2SJS5_9FIRM|nr:glycosyltransferase family 2 protein [Muricoprocola aceti]MCU6724765.1 glycosyltransferase family 2 protein [Muricoprocola aceti]SCH26667.1 Hyaluronan synthase [uncultured Clostridium sp.]
MARKEYGTQWGKMITSISPAYIKKGYRYLKRHGMKQFLIRLTERFQQEDIDYETWFGLNKATEKELQEQRKNPPEHGPLISIVVPVYRTPEIYLREMIESVVNQTYGNWELCLADASPKGEQLRQDLKKIKGRKTREALMKIPDGDTELTSVIREYQLKDSRIRYEILKENKSIAENSNAAMEMATGDFVGLLDHDDTLEPNALYEVAGKICEDDRVDVVYTDEDKINSKGTKHLTPNMKPDFNLDLLRSNNYICHLFVVRRILMEKVGGFRKEFDGAQDYDFILRCTEEAEKIAHVHKVLYHWRTHEKSTSDNPESKIYAFHAGRRAVEAHLQRLGFQAEVEETCDLGYYRVKYPVIGSPMVSILIPNKDQLQTLKKCLKSIWEKTEYTNYEILIIENNSTEKETFEFYKKIDGRHHVRVLYWDKEFNYSAINNFGATQAKGEYLLLLNNDTEVITKGWMKELLSHCQRPEVGMVGAKLYFPDNTIQSAGTIIGMGGMADHAFVNMDRKKSGYMHRASIQVDMSGVTAACAMVKRSVYEEVHGLEEKLTVAFNDVDLGLKIVTAGYLIVFDPYAELYHYESKSRGVNDEKKERHAREVKYTQEKWADFLAAGDPCYNQNLTLAKHNFSLRK